MDAVQQLARPSEAVLQRLRVDTRYIAAGAASDFDGAIGGASATAALWHDLTDEFGVIWSMPDDPPLYMDITHHPLADASLDDDPRLSVSQGRRSGPVRGPARSGARAAARDALRGRQRHLGRGLRDVLVSARAGAVVHRHAHRAGVLRDASGPDAGLLARLVPRVSRRGGRPGRRHHDRRRPGRAERPAVSGRTSTAASSNRGRSNWWSIFARGRRPRSGITPAAPARSTSPTCWTTASRSSTRCRSARRGMDPAALKARFGRELVFWGGAIDAQHVLPTASPEDVREHVRRNLDVMEARRRIRLQQRPQHPGGRAAGECRRVVRRGV